MGKNQPLEGMTKLWLPAEKIRGNTGVHARSKGRARVVFTCGRAEREFRNAQTERDGTARGRIINRRS